MVLRKKGSQWCVYSKAGKELGCHVTRKKAMKQLQAIEASKNLGDKDYAEGKVMDPMEMAKSFIQKASSCKSFAEVDSSDVAIPPDNVATVAKKGLELLARETGSTSGSSKGKLFATNLYRKRGFNKEQLQELQKMQEMYVADWKAAGRPKKGKLYTDLLLVGGTAGQRWLKSKVD